MNHRSFALSTALLFFALTVVSCSSAKKREKEDGLSLLGQGGEPVLSEERIQRLKEIADSPNATLESDGGEQIEPLELEDLIAGTEEESMDASPTSTPASVSDRLVADWAKDGLNPRSVEVGDIFSDHAGPILKKAASMADRLPAADWKTAANSISEQRSHRVPVTLSVAEINALKKSVPEDAEFPTRSVALDFRTLARTVKKPQLERIYDLISENPDGLNIEDKAALKKLTQEIKDVKTRLAAGEQLYVITSVSGSEEITATYPGAPVGSRDTVPVQNAITALYPQLDGLKAEKNEDTIRVTRDPGIYWGFEVRELKLKDGKLKVEEEALAQN